MHLSMLLSERSQLKRLHTVRFQLHDILEVQTYGDRKKVAGGQRWGGGGGGGGAGKARDKGDEQGKHRATNYAL